ncbi:XRE family transcriptional regulator [Sphingomonas parva]|uniref:XRE family transcriptional regulator n=1 Tax=Sphingomonas parva TaxID=2555898 RepID=A0A4Y8ZWQ1_9SPHN|nr:helix-turn-helix transcriptional regulator [Sphingomonas parva]TFI59139.1 XRE family transcriptional regulator [Sphingomonas parva]
MITRIREVRRARRLTLEDVASRCDPPTTPQTIGRLETGTRTVSVGWLNRIAAALDVAPGDLVRLAGAEDVPVAALLDAAGVVAPRADRVSLPPRAAAGAMAIVVSAGIGDYRAGDEIWLTPVAPEALGNALNRDVLVPRPGGRLLFGRLIGRDRDRLHILPLGAGQRQLVVANPDWAAVAVTLIRAL